MYRRLINVIILKIINTLIYCLFIILSFSLCFILQYFPAVYTIVNFKISLFLYFKYFSWFINLTRETRAKRTIYSSGFLVVLLSTPNEVFRKTFFVRNLIMHNSCFSLLLAYSLRLFLIIMSYIFTSSSSSEPFLIIMFVIENNVIKLTLVNLLWAYFYSNLFYFVLNYSHVAPSSEIYYRNAIEIKNPSRSPFVPPLFF